MILSAAFSIKIGIAAGTARRFRVGDPQIQVIDVLAGDLLNRMSRAEGTARTGEILLDAETANALESYIDIVSVETTSAARRTVRRCPESISHQ